MSLKSKGFTLIELLVVISIIALLSSVVLSSLNSARVRARDAKRVSEIRQLQNALELYRSANGVFPASGGATSPNGGWSNSNDSSWTTLQTALSPYLPRLPIDPLQSASGWAADAGTYTYAYFSMGYGCSQEWYMIVFRTENSTFPNPTVTSCDGTVFNYGGGTITTGSNGR